MTKENFAGLLPRNISTEKALVDWLLCTENQLGYEFETAKSTEAFYYQTYVPYMQYLISVEYDDYLLFIWFVVYLTQPCKATYHTAGSSGEGKL